MILIGLQIVIWPGRARAQRPLGTDVSGYQGAGVNWTSVKSDGVSYAWAKATEGVGFTDADFTINEPNAKAAGVLIGAYHYARPDLNTGTAGAAREADYFWSVAGPYIKADGLSILPMLDFEAPGVTNASLGYTRTTLSQWANAWCNRLVSAAAASGVTLRPVFYTYPNYASTWLDSTVTQWPLSMATYPSNPAPQTGSPSTSPWSNWVNWQYADTNWSGGDADVFNGTMDLLMTTLVVGNVPPANVTVNAGSNATFNVTAGGSSLSYQWKFNQANIAGATATSYTIANAQSANAGAYSVAVSNASGALFTATASLGVISPLINGAGAVVAPANMVGWWAAEGNANDIFGTSKYVPYYGVSYAAGKQGLAFHFDGSTSYLSNNTASLAVPWTICMWVNRQNAPGTGAALTGDGNSELKLEQYNGTRQVGYTKFGVADYIFSPPYSVPLGTWTHLAFVGTSTGTSLYVNGVLQASLTNSFPLPRAYVGAGWVSSSYKFVDYMLGSLDEMMIFNRALSSTEIHAISAAGSAGLVRAAEITSSGLNSSGQFNMSLAGQTGKNYTIYSSSDLINWVTAGTLTNPTGTNLFTDSNTAGTAVKFYRVSQTY